MLLETPAFERVRDQAEERGAEQRSGRETDQVRQHGRSQPVAERQERAGRDRAHRTAQRGEHDDQLQGGQAGPGSIS